MLLSHMTIHIHFQIQIVLHCVYITCTSPGVRNPPRSGLGSVDRQRQKQSVSVSPGRKRTPEVRSHLLAPFNGRWIQLDSAIVQGRTCACDDMRFDWIARMELESSMLNPLKAQASSVIACACISSLEGIDRLADF